MLIKTLQVHGSLSNINLLKHYPKIVTQITEKYCLRRIPIEVVFTLAKLT